MRSWTLGRERVGEWFASHGARSVLGVGLGASALVVVVGTTLVALPTGEGVHLTVTPPHAALTLENMAPGDSVERAVRVENSGTLPLRYAMAVVVEDDPDHLVDAMRLTVSVAHSDGACGADLDPVFSGPLGGAAMGDPALGHDPGERVLAAGDGETLCLRATFVPTAPDAHQGTSGTVTFSFYAEGPAEP